MKASIAIAAEIRSQIARRELLPGDLLPVEDELTERHGCSRPVVREALRILENEGLVEVRRGLGGGPRVRHPSVVDAARTVGLHLQLGDVPVLDVWAARDRIIGAAVERLAAGRAEAADRLAEAVAALAGNLGDLEGFNRRMLDVGEVAVRGAGNATELLLVGALRHIVEAEVGSATRRVQDDAARAQAHQEGVVIVGAWRRTLAHIRAGRPRPARRVFETQAGALRDLVGVWTRDLTVGDTAALPH